MKMNASNVGIKKSRVKGTMGSNIFQNAFFGFVSVKF